MRLIDLDKALAVLDKQFPGEEIFPIIKCNLLSCMARAKWEYKDYYWYCSNCKHEAYRTPGDGYNYDEQELFDYCPYCGAKMNGENE